MSTYLYQASYTPASMASLIQSPQDRSRIVRAVAEKLGGKLESGWLAFGDYDVVLIVQMPNDQTMAAFAMAISAGGAVARAKTTQLITWDEGVLAMRQAAQTGYQPPGRG